MDTDVAPAREPLDSATGSDRLRASTMDGTYPRPQLVRRNWTDLSGTWSFSFDDTAAGLDEGWQHSAGFGLSIKVPFPFESPASGIGETGFHPIVWYRTAIARETFSAENGERVLLHFGAVDYAATVWLNGTLLGEHEGGSTPFSFDITDALVTGEQSLVVRAFDDPFDIGQPRGKQDWQLQPHSIWYHRTTGIWQPVWIETVPDLHVTHLAWSSDLTTGSVSLQLELSARPSEPTRVDVDLWFGDELLGAVSVPVAADRVEASLIIPRQGNGQDYEQLLWSHDNPRLIDARVRVSNATSNDAVSSYLGLRSVGVERGVFLLNDRPFYVRSVLNQGYWAESHLAAPSTEALEREVRLILSLGFNSARVHQKIEDPRFLYWADRLGLLLWEEMPSAYEFSTTAVRRATREWADVIRRDSSHPSIVTWVPLNESWGVQHVAHSAQVQAYVRAMYHLTKSLDPSRPAVSNDGWEHLETDILTIHDYEGSGAIVAERYADHPAIDAMIDGVGPAGRRLLLSDTAITGQPVMLSEFGGIQYDTSSTDDAWGYTVADSAEDFAERLRSLVAAVHASTALAGFCYTQLADTGQEVNGLVTTDREPKLPIADIRGIILGTNQQR